MSTNLSACSSSICFKQCFERCLARCPRWTLYVVFCTTLRTGPSALRIVRRLMRIHGMRMHLWSAVFFQFLYVSPGSKFFIIFWRCDLPQSLHLAEQHAYVTSCQCNLWTWPSMRFCKMARKNSFTIVNHHYVVCINCCRVTLRRPFAISSLIS